MPRRLACLGILLALARVGAWGVLASEPNDATYAVIAKDVLAYLDAAHAEAVFGIVLAAMGAWIWRGEPAAGSRRDELVLVWIGSLWLALFAFTIWVLDRGVFSRDDHWYFWLAWRELLTRDQPGDWLHRLMQGGGWLTGAAWLYLQVRAAGRAALSLASEKRIGMAVTVVGITLGQLALVAAVAPWFQIYGR